MKQRTDKEILGQLNDLGINILTATDIELRKASRDINISFEVIKRIISRTNFFQL